MVVPSEQGRQWPAELDNELALKEPPAELVLYPQVQLAWLENTGVEDV